MVKPWDPPMARAMLTLKKDALTPELKEGLGLFIRLLEHSAEVHTVNPHILILLMKKYAAWYDGLGPAAETLGQPESTLFAWLREQCRIYQDEAMRAHVGDDSFRSKLLEAAERYREQVEIPVEGEAVARLNAMPEVKKQILLDHGIDVRRYFFDPGGHAAEITSAIEKYGQSAMNHLRSVHSRDAFDFVLAYLQGDPPMQYFARQAEDWPGRLERVLAEGDGSCTEEFLRGIMAEYRRYIEASEQDEEETAKKRFDLALTHLFLTWAKAFEKAKG